ncbi:uncharacterized protein LOC110451071 [Mizuhopecten yessoensis]|uniref:Uncharacterized protein n=1 Tax=Mizuhopecten yessoensis TaxID=6573 RepID=A0A210QMG0_MIZYE|nr:uncharacterized protein LOC110451071 [Mizuhopecten yessoensis]OWF49914.1 hypothetical protein KP79_PYT04004 [Mizuhopecten yessoensis]
MEAARDWVVDMFKEHVDVLTTDTTVAAATVFAVVVLLILVPFGAKFMVKGFSCVIFFEGILLLLFPEIAFKIFAAENVEPDVLHLQEIRSLGIIDIAIGMTFFLTMKSTDSTVHSSYFFSMTLLTGCCLMMEAAALSKKNPKVNPNMRNLAVHNLLIWFGLFVFHSMRQQDWGGYVEVSTSCRNTHLRLDFVIWFLTGLAAVIYPQIIYSCQVVSSFTLDATHAQNARLMGVGFIALAFMSGRASNFLREDDKKAVLLSHALACVLLLVTMGLNQILTTSFTVWHAAFGMTTVFLTLVNAILGSDPKQLARNAKQQLSKLVPVKQD